MYPRLAVGPAEEFVGFVVADDLAALGVPGERATQLHGEVGQNAARG